MIQKQNAACGVVIKRKKLHYFMFSLPCCLTMKYEGNVFKDFEHVEVQRFKCYRLQIFCKPDILKSNYAN